MEGAKSTPPMSDRVSMLRFTANVIISVGLLYYHVINNIFCSIIALLYQTFYTSIVNANADFWTPVPNGQGPISLAL